MCEKDGHFVEEFEGKKYRMIEKLMELLHRYTRLALWEGATGSEAVSQAKKNDHRFETDVAIYSEWFMQGLVKIRPKLEFFFAPYIKDRYERQKAINRIKARRDLYFHNLVGDKNNKEMSPSRDKRSPGRKTGS